MAFINQADYAEIVQLIATITSSNDAQDAAGWLACWSSNPTSTVEIVGRHTRHLEGLAELRESTRAWAGRDPDQVHLVGLVTVLDQGEDWARTTHSATLFRIRESAPRMAALAHYHDQLVREDKSWRMHQRQARIYYVPESS
jgi:hypothetical protein